MGRHPETGGRPTPLPLSSRIARTIVPDDAARAGEIVDSLRHALALSQSARAAVLDDPDVRRALEGALGVSPYLADLARRDPERLAGVLASAPEARIEDLSARMLAPAADESDLMRQFRLAKQEAALVIGLADLFRAWESDEATAALSQIADTALVAATRFLLAEEAARGRIVVPDASDPEAGSGYFVLGLGKLGAYELNYSSDIDLIVLFDREVAQVASDDPTTFFVRLTKRLVKLIGERTPDGYVFRVDLRLRPDPSSTPIALSTAAALAYYESLGQNWERAALVKARVLAGDRAAGDRFLADLVPFIWRKYLDYAAIADIHSIKRQIRLHKGHGEMAVAGHNVKLGRGGIREIEFFVQTQQLIAGGREPDLRRRKTLNALAALASHGWIGPETRDDLAGAYRFLRDVEHRIQMVADEQTHALPEDEAGLDRIARMMGHDTAQDFSRAFCARLETVARHESKLFAEAPPLAVRAGNLVFTGDDDDPETLETLSRLGYAHPKEVSRTIRGWHFGHIPATRSPMARERLTELVPTILEAFAATESADAALVAFDRFLHQLPAGFQFFSLISSNPGLLDLLATILGAAPRLAAIITRRAHVLDAVLEPAFFGGVPVLSEQRRRLETLLAEARSYEDVLDRARIFGQEQMFLIGVRVLAGALSAGRAGEAFTSLAEAIMAALFARVAAELERRHGRIAEGAAAIIAMGKLGGREMTATSDLDLILVYDHAAGSDASDGPVPLTPSAYFARLTQRLIAALSAPTAEGRLYDVDFRLRPSGNKGPVATSLASFRSYQESEAWTWERMALTRARVVAGDKALGERVTSAILAALTRPRDPEKIRADVLDMRRTLAQEKPASSIWNLKQAPGGLVDLEFIAQYLMLVHGPARPNVLATGTEAALMRLAESGFLLAAHAEILLPAVRLQHALSQAIRLATDGPFSPETAPKGLIELVVRAGGAPDLNTLAATLEEQQRAVRRCFEEIVGRLERDGA